KDAADVQTQAHLEEDDGGEREEKVGGEAGQDLDDGLGVAGQAGTEADPDADRNPDEGGEDHEHDHPGEGGESETEGVAEGAETDVAVDVSQGGPGAPAD